MPTPPASGPSTPADLRARNIVDVYGIDGAQRKLDGLKNKNTKNALALKKAIAEARESKYQAQRSRSRLTPEQLAKRGYTGDSLGSKSGKA